MSNNTKSRITCFNCQNNKFIKLNTEPTSKLEEKIEDLIKSVSFMSLKFDTFETKLESITNEIKYIKKDNEQIKLENTRLISEMNEIKYKLEQIIEQLNLGASIEMSGIPKTEH